MSEHVVVRGAREHNLKAIDVAFPRQALVVIAGPSGAGKSSLAFDTIYAEGQRRYVESMSLQARQHLERLPKARVDLIEGLSPTIGVQAGAFGASPRSTVGSVTELADLLRLLFARLGEQFCPRCGQRVESLSVAHMVDRILAQPAGARFSVRAPVARDVVGDLASEIEALKRAGFVRAVLDGRRVELSELRLPVASRSHSLAAEVDRLAVKPEARARLADSLELALRVGAGVVIVAFEGGEELLLSDRAACTRCGLVLGVLEPASLSRHSPQGACEACAGLGLRMRVDPERVVQDAALSLRQGAIAAWGPPGRRYYQSMLERLLAAVKVDPDAPFETLSQALRTRILHGSAAGARARGHEGVIAGLERRLNDVAASRADRETTQWLENELAPFLQQDQCEVCLGSGLSARARAVKLQGTTFHELSDLPVSQLTTRLSQLSWPGAQASIAEPVLREMQGRLSVLGDLGVAHLSLARKSQSLSRGEAERIRLATHLSAGLSGVLYVLDEPTTGLHPRDTERLLAVLAGLKQRGNTLLVVEHDLDVIAAADHVIDMGPGSGERGGQVMASGTPAQIAAAVQAPTGRYLSAHRGIELPAARAAASSSIAIRDARAHNLRGVDADVPIGRLTCVTGVSGSGKSSLIMHTLVPALQDKLAGTSRQLAATVTGLDGFARVVHVDQSPIGRTPRSAPVTYAGIFAPIRELFAGLPEARARGFGPERFSFNVKGGRCEQCQGAGVMRVEMQYLADVYVTCELCHGKRYDRETLEVRYRGRSIADLLEGSVDDASEWLGHLPRVAEALASLRVVGLGYLRLGQSATTLSAGEAQRVRLARELARKDAGITLYALDEPTAGLHLSEIELLARVLDGLVEAGHTVVVIEHSLELVKRADHVIDLGPEGGAEGGCLLVQGPPAAVAGCALSHTGRFLAQRLDSAR